MGFVYVLRAIQCRSEITFYNIGISKYNKNKYVWAKNEPSSVTRSRSSIKIISNLKSTKNLLQLNLTHDFSIILFQILFSKTLRNKILKTEIFYPPFGSKTILTSKRIKLQKFCRYSLYKGIIWKLIKNGINLPNKIEQYKSTGRLKLERAISPVSSIAPNQIIKMF